MATHSNGISALQLQSQLGLGSYRTAWMLCAKLRRTMVDPDRQPLRGIVEADETIMPLLKNESVETADPAPPHRRTHGRTGAGVLALVSSPCCRRRWPAAQALQGPSVPGYDRHRRTEGLRFKNMGSRQASCRALHHPFEISMVQKKQDCRGRRRISEFRTRARSDYGRCCE
jgi:hypothetical protein